LTPVKGKSIYEASWRLDRTSEESKLASSQTNRQGIP